MKRIRWRQAAWIAGAILIVWFVVGVILAGRDTPPIPPSSMPVTLRGGVVRGNHISTRSWSFGYRSAEMSPDGSSATIEGVKNGVLYKKGKPYLSLSAEHVMLDTQSLNFTAIGDVHIAALHPKDGIPKSFDSDFVQWMNGTKMLTLAHPSIFKTGDQTLRVASITVNFNDNSIHLGKVAGSVEEPGS